MYFTAREINMKKALENITVLGEIFDVFENQSSVFFEPLNLLNFYNSLSFKKLFEFRTSFEYNFEF